MSIFDDPNFDEMFSNAIYNSREDVVDAVDVSLTSGKMTDANTLRRSKMYTAMITMTNGL